MEFLGRYEREAYLHHIILLSQKPDPRRYKSIHFDQDCASVWNFDFFF
jgi:hypothetical protein